MYPKRGSDHLDQVAADFTERGRDFVLAVVLEAVGSTPCKAGARAIVDDKGIVAGTVGGGLTEAKVLRHAAEAFFTQRPAVLHFGLENHSVGEDQPICGGWLRVLIDPTAARHGAAWRTACSLRQRRQRGAILTTIRNEQEVTIECLDEPAICLEGGFPDVNSLRACLEHEEVRLFVSEGETDPLRLEVLVQPVVAQPRLLIVGGGHVGQAVAAQASLVGFDIAVIDDRPEFAVPERFPPGANIRCGPLGDELTRHPLDRTTFVVIVTRGHQQDAEALAACLHKPAAFIGMIGSRRKVALMRQEFVDSGRATPEQFDRVYAPIGLDIGSVTVPEIATSITAQLIAVRRKGISPRIAAR